MNLLSLFRRRQVAERVIPEPPRWHPSEGWHPWCYPFPTFSDGRRCPRPHDYEYVEAMRAEWDRPAIMHVASIHPAFNVAGLCWRPARPAIDGELAEQLKALGFDG